MTYRWPVTISVEILGRAIKQAQYRHQRALDGRLRDAGTTLAQWDALRAIDRNPGASAHDLASETFQGDQSFGTLANRLEAQGLIRRSPGRGRRIAHRLTPAGDLTLAAGRVAVVEVLDESFSGLTEDERSMLFDVLARIGKSLTS
jgi:DNA-binding MarR family transcriptional regulator